MRADRRGASNQRSEVARLRRSASGSGSDRARDLSSRASSRASWRNSWRAPCPRRRFAFHARHGSSPSRPARVGLTLGGKPLIDSADLVGRARRPHLPRRPQRLGQIDPAQDRGRRDRGRPWRALPPARRDRALPAAGAGPFRLRGCLFLCRRRAGAGRRRTSRPLPARRARPDRRRKAGDALGRRGAPRRALPRARARARHPAARRADQSSRPAGDRMAGRRTGEPALGAGPRSATTGASCKTCRGSRSGSTGAEPEGSIEGFGAFEAWRDARAGAGGARRPETRPQDRRPRNIGCATASPRGASAMSAAWRASPPCARRSARPGRRPARSGSASPRARSPADWWSRRKMSRKASATDRS